MSRVEELRRVALDECVDTLDHRRGRVFAGHREHVFAMHSRREARFSEHGVEVLLDEVRLALFDHQHGAFPFTEPFDLIVDQRIRHVEHVERHVAGSERISEAQELQGPRRRVVHPALENDAEIVGVLGKVLVEAVVLNELLGRGPPLLDLLLLVKEAGRWQHDTIGIPDRILDGVLECERRPHVGLGCELPVNVAGANPELEHDRRVGRLREGEALLDGLHDRRQIRARIK